MLSAALLVADLRLHSSRVIDFPAFPVDVHEPVRRILGNSGGEMQVS